MSKASSFDYDLIVIGAGSGGVRASRIAAGYGARVAVIEESRPGGTCVIRGCVPKKLLVYGAAFADEFEDAEGFGWTVQGATHDWAKLLASKDVEIDRLETVYRGLIKNAGATLIEGRGILTGPHSVAVGDTTITGEKILVAVGGWPHLPDVPGLQDVAITSNEALDLQERPEQIVIYGSGYIAVEFAGIFNALGSEVHLVYRGDMPLRGFDEDVRAHLADAISARGIHLHKGATISSVSKHGGKTNLLLSDGTSIDCDVLMAATGRLPNTAQLGLGVAGVETNAKGAIIVDENGQTNVSSIFAVGDVTDRVNLTPVALTEGHIFADRYFGDKPRVMSHETIASAVFSQPPIASVGMTEAEASAEYDDIEIYDSRFRAMRNTLSGRDERTYMKLIVDATSDKVLGVHMVGPDAAEILQGIAIAVKMGATKADFDATIGIHPSAAEEFVTMRTPRTS